DDIDFVLGADGDDEVSAGDGADVVKLGAGHDTASGGGGDDSIEGEAGGDTIAGDGGNDLLTGGAGADTYVYNLGDGNDVVSDAGEADASVIDTLRFEVSMADVALTRTQGGDLLARLADGGTVRVAAMYSFNSVNALERVEFADGSFLDADALASLPEGLVLGTDGADVLVGSSFDDTIEGRAGDDLLNGGDQGNDTLIGGAGHDRYRLGYGTERDTVVEAAGEASTVELDQGLSLADLRASQSGDDLVLTLRGTGNEFVVQDYFSSGQHVTVSEAGGVSATAEQVLASSPPLDRESLKEDFRIAERAAFFRGWIAAGLTPVDGSTLAGHDYPE
ncbi:MAG: calcium-binding protein, partial [Candidatus Binatia bacterium]